MVKRSAFTLFPGDQDGYSVSKGIKCIVELTYTVSYWSEFVERLDVEPGALVSSRIQGDAHGIFLQKGR